MSTPEGLVKAKVKKVLDKYREHLYVLMPVQNGMGTPTLDYLGWFKGHPFGIETKAGKARMTPRQELTAEKMRAGGAMVFLINEVEGLDELEAWLDYLKGDF